MINDHPGSAAEIGGPLPAANHAHERSADWAAQPLTPSQAAAAAMGSILADEIWWEEILSLGDFSETIRIKPDRYAAQTIAVQVLKRAGFDELVEALKPFADLGVGQGPDDEHDAHPYRLTRGSIRKAREALANVSGQTGGD